MKRHQALAAAGALNARAVRLLAQVAQQRLARLGHTVKARHSAGNAHSALRRSIGNLVERARLGHPERTGAVHPAPAVGGLHGAANHRAQRARRRSVQAQAAHIAQPQPAVWTVLHRVAVGVHKDAAGVTLQQVVAVVFGVLSAHMAHALGDTAGQRDGRHPSGQRQ